LLKQFFIKLDKIVERVGNWGLLSSGILILVMGFLSTFGVVRRYVFHSPEPFSYELSTIFLTACGVLGVSGLQRFKRHLRVDFIANYFPATIQVVFMDIIAPLLALVYVTILTWQSWSGAVYSFSVHETSQSAWQEVLWPIKFIIPITMFWLCLVLIAQLVHGIITLARGNVKAPVIGQETNPDASLKAPVIQQEINPDAPLQAPVIEQEIDPDAPLKG
jgi:TRAP-type mannitol/chloroaromatic compound transport system permease small subunit